MKKAITLIVISLTAVCALAQTFVAGGVCYRIKEGETAKCEVTYPPEGTYAGTISVPSSVKDEEGTQYSVVGIGEYAFAGSEGLTSLTLPSTINSVGRNAFQGCSSLQTVKIPPMVREIKDQTFYGCASLETLSLPSVTSVGPGAFASCPLLSLVYFGENLTFIGDAAFKGCRSLKSITLPKSTVLGTAVFETCTSLTTVVLPSDLKVLPDDTFNGCISLTRVSGSSGLVEIGDRAFYSCENLETFLFTSSLRYIGTNAFGFCESLTLRAIEGTDLEIGRYAFSGCISLVEVVMKGVAVVGEEAFANDEAIVSVTFDETVTDIRNNVFLGCLKISRVTVEAPVPPRMQNNAFASEVYAKAVLVVPFGKSQLYRQSPPWSNFILVEEMEDTGIDSAAIPSMETEVYVKNGSLVITGPANPYSVYTLKGEKILEGVKDEGEVSLPISAGGLIVVRVGNTAYKIFSP